MGERHRESVRRFEREERELAPTLDVLHALVAPDWIVHFSDRQQTEIECPNCGRVLTLQWGLLANPSEAYLRNYPLPCDLCGWKPRCLR